MLERPDQPEFHRENNVPISEIEEFAKMLVRIRDAAIQSADRRLQPDAASVVAKRWRATMSDATPESFAKTIIPDIVDETISQLLLAIDQQLLPLSFSASTGKTVDLPTEGLGELCGWYGGGSGGWVAEYSKERFTDDYSDV
jgi:hypothetical protein